jgi:hypothetical protein
MLDALTEKSPKVAEHLDATGVDQPTKAVRGVVDSILEVGGYGLQSLQIRAPATATSGPCSQAAATTASPRAVENELNHWPRRILQDRCPAELFTALLTSRN